MGAVRHCDGMNINMYVINAILVLMVVRQIREHSLDLRSLAVPVLAVGAAAVMFLHSVPGGGSDIALELAGVSAGAAMGAVGGLATRLRRGADGRALGRAGALAAGMWVAGVGGRMAFVFAATHGAGPAIGRFSIAHHITGSGGLGGGAGHDGPGRRADPAGRGLPARPPPGRGPGGRPGAHPGRHPCLIWYPSPP